MFVCFVGISGIVYVIENLQVGVYSLSTIPSTTVFSLYIFPFLMFRNSNKTQLGKIKR
jgi:hypothetical protein